MAVRVIERGSGNVFADLGLPDPGKRQTKTRLATLLGNEAQTVALWEKRATQPKIAGRVIRALWREQDEGNVHIREMIERLADTDAAGGAERIVAEQDAGGWKVAA